jgi:DNA repair protein RadC
LGQHILQTLSDAQQDPLHRLRDISVQELMTVSGVGVAKAATIGAAIELGKRIFCHIICMTHHYPVFGQTE